MSVGELIAFFTDEQAARLARISVRQLRYWRGGDGQPPVFFSEYSADADGGSVSTFRDVVALRTLGMLRRRLPLQELRKIGEWLHVEYESPWSSLRFSVRGKEILFEEPETGAQFAVTPRGQKVLSFEMEQIAHDLTGDIQRLFQRSTEQRGRINKRGLIDGTRIEAATIWKFMAEGFDTEKILREYPTLSADDVQAAVQYETDRRPKVRAAR